MQLYIHVPFCRKKCGYCAFHSLALPEAGNGAALIGRYFSGLLEELRLWGERLGSVALDTIFFGGGTPSLLPAKAVGGILEAAARHFTFAPHAEISAEANPDSALDNGWLFAVRRAGVNRLSLGVQSFDARRLAVLGRIHDARAAEAAFHAARAAGFTNINLDLIWGLPGKNARPQAQTQWLGELEKSVRLCPEHISAYGLTLEEGTPLARDCAEGRLTLPDEKAAASMYLAGAQYLQSNGYMQYEISNYARPGFECGHNLGYWRGREYLGIGPSATSTLANRRWTNPSDIGAWLGAIARGEIAGGAEVLSEVTRRKEFLMLCLRTAKGMSLRDWKERCGGNFLHDHAPLVSLLQKEGLAATRQGRFRLTRTGMLVSDAILAHFFERLE